MNQTASDVGPPTDLATLVREAIERVAPDVDAATIPGDVDFREEAELDSMDFLGVLNAVQDASGIAVPELDYPQIITVAGFADYLDRHLVGS